jgi:hypothetical protein
MSKFELPQGSREGSSILNKYRPNKRRGNHIDSDVIEEGPTGYPGEGDNIDGSGANSLYPAPFSLPRDSSTAIVSKDNDQPDHSRLNEIAQALRTLTYGQMIELAESMCKLNPQGSEITESNLPNVLYRWSKSRSIVS